MGVHSEGICRAAKAAFLTLTALALSAGPAHALVGGFRQPIHGAGGQRLYDLSNQSVLSVNPEREVIEAIDGSKTISSIEIDQAEGTFKGYASYQLGQPNTIARPADPGLVNVDGKMIFIGDVKVDAALAQSGLPAVLSFDMSVHGRFEDVSGKPWLALVSALTVQRYVGGFAGPLINYESELGFSTVTDAGWTEQVEPYVKNTLLGLKEGDPGYPSATWSSSGIVSSDPSDLSGVLRLSVPVADGDTVVIIGLMAGLATHSYALNPDTVDVAEPIDILPAGGAVNFLNTGRLRVILPAGVTLLGPNAPGGKVLASAVREPSAAALAVAGLALVWRFRRLRSRASHPAPSVSAPTSQRRWPPQ